MDERDELAARFETHRRHLRAVAYRMLGSLSETDDAVQEAWLRLSRSDAGAIDNLGGWLTTVTGRICLNMLESRSSRREEPLESYVPDPVVTRPDDADPEQRAVLADSVGIALLVVLNTLPPAERLAFVLHDMFAVSFEEIAPIVERTPTATRQLASRARRRVREAAPPRSNTDLGRQYEIVEAFMAAARGGDFEALVALLDPTVILRVDAGALASRLVRGARAVAGQALTFSRLAPYNRRVLVNGAAGIVTVPATGVAAIMAFTITDGRITRLDLLADPARLRALPELG